MKKGIVLTDFHSGHLAGLTPPNWRSLQPKWDRLESELWDNYISMIHKHGPYDFGFFLGDLIDGTGARSGGTELITTDRNKQVEIAVMDNGMGIPESIRHRIFDRFYTTKRNLPTQGTGQGLTMARSIVEEHHCGRITFESEVERGTTFYIRLPLDRPAERTR